MAELEVQRSQRVPFLGTGAISTGGSVSPAVENVAEELQDGLSGQKSVTNPVLVSSYKEMTDPSQFGIRTILNNDGSKRYMPYYGGLDLDHYAFADRQDAADKLLLDFGDGKCGVSKEQFNKVYVDLVKGESADSALLKQITKDSKFEFREFKGGGCGVFVDNNMIRSWARKEFAEIDMVSTMKKAGCFSEQAINAAISESMNAKKRIPKFEIRKIESGNYKDGFEILKDGKPITVDGNKVFADKPFALNCMEKAMQKADVDELTIKKALEEAKSGGQGKPVQEVVQQPVRSSSGNLRGSIVAEPLSAEGAKDPFLGKLAISPEPGAEVVPPEAPVSPENPGTTNIEQGKGGGQPVEQPKGQPSAVENVTKKTYVTPEIKPASENAKTFLRYKMEAASKSGSGRTRIIAWTVGGLLAAGAAIFFGAKACSGDDNKQQLPPAGGTDGSSGQSSGAGQSEQPSQPSKPDNSQNITNPINHTVKSGETYWGHAEADLMTGKLSNLYGNDITVDSLTTLLMSKNNAEWDKNHYMSKPILKVGAEITVANYKERITEKAKAELKAEGKTNPTNDEIKAKCKEIKENLLAQIPSSHRSTKLVLNEVSFE